MHYPSKFGSKLKKIRKDAVKTTHKSDKGRKTFQPNLISWSYLNLGRVALTHKNINKRMLTLRKNQTKPGTAFRKSLSIGGNQPPKNKIVPKELISIIAEYSPKKNIANNMEEYSVKYPATNADSSSGKSKGGLFVSARAEITNTINIGKRGKTNQQFFWANTILERFNDPTHNNTVTITKPIDTS